jgi:DNA-binding CsgD family transcriptional regulator
VLTTVVVLISLVAFLTAPPAFILLWILHRQTADRAVGVLSFAILALAFELFGNLLIQLASGSARPLPYGVFVLLLNTCTISAIAVGGLVCRFAHSATQTPVKPALRLAFWSWAFLLHTLILSAAMLPSATDVTNAFAIGATANFLMQLYATVLIVAKRKRIPAGFFLPHFTRYSLLLLPLGLLSVASDIFRFGQRLGGNGIPFSPFFCLLINGSLIALISRRLISRGSKASRENAATADFRLTLRESEILPFLLEGASNDQIGVKLHISPHTVKNHITDIFRKTGAESRFDLLKTFKRMESLNRGA